mgnify:CR=1 FL=1
MNTRLSPSQRNLRRPIWPALLLALSLSSVPPAQAQSDASGALSAISVLPVASVVVTASVAAGAVVALPLASLTMGTVLVVKVVEVTARGTVYVLERASDGARLSIDITGRGLRGSAIGVGTAVTVSVIGAGTLLSVAGEVIAFIPNALGRALLHDERLTD